MELTTIQEIHSHLIDDWQMDENIYWIKKQAIRALEKMGLLLIDRAVVVATVQDFTVELDPIYFRPLSLIRLDSGTLMNINITYSDLYFPPQEIFIFPSPGDIVETQLLEANVIPDIKGPYLDFNWDFPYLRVNIDNIAVAAEVLKLRVDEAGYPLIPRIALDGIVAWCVYVYYRPMFLAGKIDGQRMQFLEETKNRYINQAKSTSYLQGLSRNQWDNILDVITSYDRKHFNINS